ncbi:MAG: AAA family ATPase [Defluviitaleaceae bacterium]|nr:AAA family ATPase [Defluviitaleaceae bacterium]
MLLDSLANAAYVIAVNEARLQRHEYVTPEHLLYSALMFDDGKAIIEGHGGVVYPILNDLKIFFETRIPKCIERPGDHDESGRPAESAGFTRIFELAAAQTKRAGHEKITLARLIAAMFFLPQSFAKYFLAKSGINRIALLSYSRTAAAQPAEEKRGKDDGFLNLYTVDLCEKASRGQLDPLVGREDILERTIRVLCRRLKNNPVHVGDPGVGKTALVEGLAQRIADRAVPEPLLCARILKVNIGAMLAGTKYRGEFEERLVKLLDIAASMKKAVLYIDEIHTAMGAGAVSGGAMDATAIIKPYLSSGSVRFIGSTTYDEFKKHFEKDRALARRFQPIEVDEPSAEECVSILAGLRPHYERYHGVKYSDQILSDIVTLSVKYLYDRYLPDKAIDIMDEAGSCAGISGESEISRGLIEKTVALMAKTPEATVSADEQASLFALEDDLNKEVFGQAEAARMVATAVKTSRAGLGEPEKPVACLLFVGPTGVGKTEMARQLAKRLSVKLLRFDMSEYQERHAVARLIGAPPGYVGYEEGGLLTDAVRRSPHTVLLLDEIEKAHADIQNVLLQVMDYGTLTDNAGKKTDFKNAVLIMTSNAGAAEMEKKPIGIGSEKDYTLSGQAVEKMFSPEFRNRLDAVVRFNPIDSDMALLVAKKALAALAEKLSGKNVGLQSSSEAEQLIAADGLSAKYGARAILRRVENDVKKPLVNELLFGRLASGGAVNVAVENGSIVLLYGGNEQS